MAKKQVEAPEEQGKTTADYYKLNTEAIDRLVNADSEPAQEVSDKELKQYGAKKHISLSGRLKALLIKFWFNGVVCYFFIWGLGVYIQNALDLWLVTAVALGFVTDLLTNNVLFLADRGGDISESYIMIKPRRKFITLPLNIVYAIVLMALDVTTYALIAKIYPIGVEPLLFGALTTLWDIALIKCKKLFLRILSDAREKASAGGTKK